MNEKVNESFLLKRGEQAAQLEAQLEQIRTVLGQRGGAAVGTLIDGLSALVANARAGDLGARRVLRQVNQLLDEIEVIGAIALPGD